MADTLSIKYDIDIVVSETCSQDLEYNTGHRFYFSKFQRYKLIFRFYPVPEYWFLRLL